MKRKITAFLAVSAAAALALTGCQTSTSLENDYIKITQYKNLEVDYVTPASEVTDADVTSAIQTNLESISETSEITDRAVESGDTVNIDFVGKMDGKAFDGGSAEDYDLEIGSGTFIDGFEDSVIGHEIGDTYDWNGQFPEDYGSEEFNGKDVTFTITVNSISNTYVPELNEDTVSKLSDTATTVSAYKEEVKKQLEQDAEDTYNDTLQQNAWNAVLDKTEVKKYPEDEVNSYKDRLVSTYEEYADYYNMEFADFLEQQMNMTEDEFDEEMTNSAESVEKSVLITNAIAEAEKIELDDTTYNERMEAMAEDYGYEDVDTMLEEAGEEGEAYMKQTILNQLVMEWLADHCVQVK